MGKAERTKELGTFFSRAKSGVDHAEIDTKILAACLSFLAIWHLACCCDVYDCYCCFAMLVHKNVAVNNTVVNHKWKRPNIKKNIKQQQISKTKPTKRTRVASGWQKFHLLKSLSRVFAIVPLLLANIFVMSGNFSRVCNDNCNCSLSPSRPVAQPLFPISKHLACNSFAVYTAKDNLSWHKAKLSLPLAGRRPHSMETCRKFINSSPAPSDVQHFPATQL